MSNTLHLEKPGGFELRVATSSDREVIYRLRHEVYALEIGQLRRIPMSGSRMLWTTRTSISWLVAEMESQAS